MEGIWDVERGKTMGESRIDALGWGVLFVAVGAVLLAPGLPDGAWLVAAGAVMLGASALRAWCGMDVPWITPLVGTTAFVGGGAGILGLESEGWPLVLVAVGLVIVALGLQRPGQASAGSSPRAGR